MSVPIAAATRAGRSRRRKAEHVGDRVLAGVPHPLGEQEHHGEERDEEADRVDEPVEAEEVDQAGDAEERRGRQVVAGDREAVLEAGDAAAGGVEADGARGALGRPVGDAERDRAGRSTKTTTAVVLTAAKTIIGLGSAVAGSLAWTSSARCVAILVVLVVRDRLLGERVEVLGALAQVQQPEHEDHHELREREAVADGQPLVDALGHEVLGVGHEQDEAHVPGRGRRSSPAGRTPCASARAPGTRASARSPPSRSLCLGPSPVRPSSSFLRRVS